MSRAILVDTTRCIGCRSCQVSCKQWNDLPAEKTEIEGTENGYQNPSVLSAKTFTVVTFHEVEDPEAPGGLKWAFVKRQCMHCNEPACVSACPVTALQKTKEGPVVYDETRCLGCRYCLWACPFGVPTAEWDSLAPEIRKCTMCVERLRNLDAPAELDGKPLAPEAALRIAEGQAEPACVKACSTGALKFGERDRLLAEAWGRIHASPGKYFPHVYGEKEAGGTAYLYLAAVPFERLGFKTDLGERGYASYSIGAMKAVPPSVVGLGALLGGIYLLQKRKQAVADESRKEKRG
jgi:formate dehydrogenase iron-sulfur subunit